jgi:homoserine kinase type II
VAQFTPLDAARLETLSVRFGLGGVPAATPLWAGTINSNFRLETTRGPLFLRVNEGKTEADVAYEAELLLHLAARGVRTPQPLVADDGRGYAEIDGLLVTLFPWAPGAHHDPPGPADCHALGAALAALHRAGAGFPRRRASRYAFPRIVERVDAINDPPADVAAALVQIRAEIVALADYAPPDDGVIHGDLFPDNVLFDPAGACLLDFEQASDGSFAYDLAVCMLAWCWDGALDPARVAALRAGYGPVDDGALVTAARVAALRFTVTRITDVALDPRASPEIRRVKDYRDYLARLRALSP